MSKLRKSTPPPADGIAGPLRFVRGDDDVSSLTEGDIALVDLPDLDARHADDLIAARVAAVLNAATSSSGRIPNQGPSMLAQAGIALLDLGGQGLTGRVKAGDVVQLLDGRVIRDGETIGRGVEVDEAKVRTDLKSAERGLATRLDSLAANATDHIHREQAMLLDGAHVPRLRTKIRKRPVVVVSRSYDAQRDLAGLKRYIRQHDPVLIGAAGGADLLLDAGHTPDVVIGAIDDITDRAIKGSGEVVVATATGRVERPERLERHGKEVVTFTSTGSSDDLAILLADTNEASVVVHAGGPPTMQQFLDQAPSDGARLFVARLRAGAKIVDAKAVSQLVVQSTPWWPFLLMLLAGVLAVGFAVALTPGGQDGLSELSDRVSDLFTSIGGSLP